MPTTYLDFADLFRKLSPYELDHFSEVLLCKIESSVEGELFSKHKTQLSEKDIKTALTEAMRDIAIEMRERKLSSARLELNNAKASMFAYAPVKAA